LQTTNSRCCRRLLVCRRIVLVDVSVVVPILMAMKSLAEPPLLRLARFLVRPLLKALFCQFNPAGFGTPGSARLILGPPRARVLNSHGCIWRLPPGRPVPTERTALRPSGDFGNRFLKSPVHQNQRDTTRRLHGVKPVESPTPTGCRRRKPASERWLSSGIIITTDSELFRQP
jgi:hypothetical protein